MGSRSEKSLVNRVLIIHCIWWGCWVRNLDSRHKMNLPNKQTIIATKAQLDKRWFILEPNISDYAQEHWSKFPQIPCLKVIIVSLLFYTNTTNRNINQYFFSQLHEWEPQVGGYSKTGGLYCRLQVLSDYMFSLWIGGSQGYVLIVQKNIRSDTEDNEKLLCVMGVS